MSGTASGVTTFVLGREAEGNREVHVFEDGQAYEFDYDLAQDYTSADATFPYVSE